MNGQQKNNPSEPTTDNNLTDNNQTSKQTGYCEKLPSTLEYELEKQFRTDELFKILNRYRG